MRCPKCGYISFDHLEKCLKCKKDIEAVSGDLYGSTYNIEAPGFLQLKKEKKEEQEDVSEDIGLSEEVAFDDEDEYIDEDLQILMGESDPEPEVELEEEEIVTQDDQEEENEIEIDFSQFEDGEEAEADVFVGEKDGDDSSLTIEMPEELADLSDLSPPGKGLDEEEDVKAAPAGKVAEAGESDDDSDFADLNLDDLDFDLGLGDGEAEPEKSPATPEEAVLALDEIDFAETLAESSTPSNGKSDEMDLDLDLDFDLDLGGLSTDDKK